MEEKSQVKHRQAYCVMAHNEWRILNILLQQLDLPENDIYLHVDKKVLSDYRNYKFDTIFNATLYNVENQDVKWGG